MTTSRIGGPRVRPPRAGPAASAALALALAAGCSSSAESAPSGGVTGSITVLAASSLTGTFTDLARQFEGAHHGTHVTFSFGSSATLAAQITGGAPADVFASASTTTMAGVVAAGDAAGPVDIASNRMEIATPPGNPRKIARLADLARPGVTVALCQAAAPCGVAATAVLAKAGVSLRATTLEADVKSTLAKVEADEVDAGIVYVSDVRAAGPKVVGIPIPDAVNVSTKYPVAVLSASRNKITAQAFVDYVHSPQALAVLTAAGFLPP